MSSNRFWVRPLVVLDLAGVDLPLLGGGGRTAEQGLVDMLREAADGFWVDSARSLAQMVADQIAAQITPPTVRMEKPGAWAVVKAIVPIDGEGLFLRTSEHDPQHWQDRQGDWWEWHQLIDPTPVRDGIEEQA